MSEKTVVSAKNFARQLTYGFLVECGKWIVIASIIVGAYNYFHVRGAPYDDTDGQGVVSEIRPRTDHLTGCQYLESSAGSLTPRLNASGKQICGKS